LTCVKRADERIMNERYNVRRTTDSRAAPPAWPDDGPPTSEDVTRATVDAWSALSRTCETWWTRQFGREAVAARAAERTRDLLSFARRHSPFYRALWHRLPSPSPELSSLPPVTKHELMARFDDWVTDPQVNRRDVEAFLADRSRIGSLYRDRYVLWKSSGTSGEPGIFVQDASALSVYDALLNVQLQSPTLAGSYALGVVTHGGRAALVAATGDHFATIASWRRACRNNPWPAARAFSVMAPLPELTAALNAYQPAFLASYSTTLGILAAEQREGRLAIAPACVWSGGEYLAPSAAASIQRAFGGVLMNEYGASECMSIAFSCPAAWLHVNADWVIAEPVDRDYRPTAPGDTSHTLLITNLANRIQPIIRYDLGDRVVVKAEPCSCGSPLPAIRPEGRRDDVLALCTADGSIVRLSPLALTTVVEDATSCPRFQIVQTAPDEITLRLAVADARERELAFDATARALGAYLAHQSLSNVRLSLAADPPAVDPRSGKFREVIAAARA